MIQVGARTKIFVALKPVDFRCGYSKLSSFVRNILDEDPMTGHIFLFRNRSSTAVKIITFDGRACWTIHAKFAQGKLSWWPYSDKINSAQLMSLLSQGNMVSVPEAFREIS